MRMKFMKFKQIFSLILIVCITLYSFGNFNIRAISVEQKEIVIDELFSTPEYDMHYYESDLSIKVTIFSKTDSSVDFVTYNKETNDLYINGEKQNRITNYVVNTTLSSNSLSSNIYGPFRGFYDVNPFTVATVVGVIMAVAAFVSTAGAAGVGLAALHSGTHNLFYYAGAGSLMRDWFPNARVNGFFEYFQEISLNGCRARNINRLLYMRVANKSSATYSYGNGTWFTTSSFCL